MKTKHPLLESILFHLPILSVSSRLLLRPIDPATDLPVIYQWVNQPYAIPFWQMNGSQDLLEQAFTEMQQSTITLSLAGCLNNELVCQLDLYDPFSDPVGQCYSPQKGDIGIHLLVAPGKKPVPDFTAKLLYFLMHCLFTHSGTLRIIGEPDEHNDAANRLLHKLSFEFHRAIQLPDKKANFYTMRLEQFAHLSVEDFSF